MNRLPQIVTYGGEKVCLVSLAIAVARLMRLLRRVDLYSRVATVELGGERYRWFGASSLNCRRLPCVLFHLADGCTMRAPATGSPQLPQRCPAMSATDRAIEA
jgi:hypothetical protein